MGLPLSSQPFAQPSQEMQLTGFIQPQFTAVPSFSQSPFQPQPTAFLQPQMTGFNPFRQNTLPSQSTVQPPFAMSGASPAQPTPAASTNPFPVHHQEQGQGFQSTPFTQPTFSNAPNFNSMPFSSSMASPPTSQNGPGVAVPVRPASTPITHFGLNKSASPPPQPVKSHQTGSRNPFGAPVAPPPPLPKPPTLLELAMGYAGRQDQQNQLPQSPQTGTNAIGGIPRTSSPSPLQGSTMASVATSFSMNKPEDKQPSVSGLPSFSTGNMTTPVSSQPTSTTVSGSGFSDSVFSSLSSQPTSNAATPSFSNPLKPQTTGFTGLKQFKPTSSFGATLLESLPPIPQSNPGTPGASQSTSPAPNSSPFASGMSPFPSFSTSLAGNQSNGVGSSNGMVMGSSIGSQPTGLLSFGTQPAGTAGGLSPSSGNASTVGVGLRPQPTGAGAANPFRATMMIAGGPTSGTSSFGGSGSGFSSSNSTPAVGDSSFSAAHKMPSLFSQSTGMPNANPMLSYGSNLFAGAYGSNSVANGQQQTQQQKGTASLI